MGYHSFTIVCLKKKKLKITKKRPGMARIKNKDFYAPIEGPWHKTNWVIDDGLFGKIPA